MHNMLSYDQVSQPGLFLIIIIIINNKSKCLPNSHMTVALSQTL